MTHKTRINSLPNDARKLVLECTKLFEDCCEQLDVSQTKLEQLYRDGQLTQPQYDIAVEQLRIRVHDIVSKLLR